MENLIDAIRRIEFLSYVSSMMFLSNFIIYCIVFLLVIEYFVYAQIYTNNFKKFCSKLKICLIKNKLNINLIFLYPLFNY